MKQNTQIIQNKIKNMPNDPGVYIMKNSHQEIIYIGKARSLKKRVNSYFQKKELDAKTQVLVKNIYDLEFIVTDSEIEALLLENNLIKKHKPKFNIRLKDDKMYPYIVITLSETYPRVMVTRTITNKKNKYFGPYTDSKAARKTVEVINSIFKLKTCTKKLPLKKNERPCLNFQIQKCSGICQNIITKDEYLLIIDSVINFLNGNIEKVLSDLNNKMKQFSSEMFFEKAAEIRNIIFDIQHISEKQKISTPIGYDQDYIGITSFEDEAIVVIFEFRKGILLGRKISTFQNINFSNEESIIESFIIDYYNRVQIPNQIIIQYKISNQKIIENFLKQKSAKNVIIHTPRSTDEKAIINLISKNINIIYIEKKSAKISADKQKGLLELQKVLSLPRVPVNMVCFDISNLQGTNSVASMAFFKDGLPYKSEYRKFKIRGYESANDPGMIHEAVARYLQNLSNELLAAPDLIVIDGGITQLTKALEAASALDFNIPIISIAKKFEEIYYDIKDKPLRLSKDSPGLKIIQNLRDETHRFGITYHRKLRHKDNFESVLEKIPSIGATKRNILLTNFKSIDEIKNASEEELNSIKGLNKKNIQNIISYFKEIKK